MSSVRMSMVSLHFHLSWGDLCTHIQLISHSIFNPSPFMTREVGMLIKQLHDNGVTILCVTHDIRLARLLSDNVTFLNHGKIRAEGTFTNLALRETDPDIHCFFSEAQR